MQLFSAEVGWYDEYRETGITDLVVGFADNMADFVRRVEDSFSCIEDITIHVINSYANKNELIYVSQEGLRAIEEENDYD